MVCDLDYELTLERDSSSDLNSSKKREERFPLVSLKYSEDTTIVLEDVCFCRERSMVVAVEKDLNDSWPGTAEKARFRKKDLIYVDLIRLRLGRQLVPEKLAL